MPALLLALLGFGAFMLLKGGSGGAPQLAAGEVITRGGVSGTMWLTKVVDQTGSFSTVDIIAPAGLTLNGVKMPNQKGPVMQYRHDSKTGERLFTRKYQGWPQMVYEAVVKDFLITGRIQGW